MTRQRHDPILTKAEACERFWILARGEAPGVFDDLAGEPFNAVLPLETVVSDYFRAQAQTQSAGDAISTLWWGGWCRRRWLGEEIPRNLDYRTINGGGCVFVEPLEQAAEAAILAWAGRSGLVGPDALQPEWCRALTLRTLGLWCHDRQAYKDRRLPIGHQVRSLATLNADTLPPRPVVVPRLGEEGMSYRRRREAADLTWEDDLVHRGLAVRERGNSTRYLLALVYHNCAGQTWEKATENAATADTSPRVSLDEAHCRKGSHEVAKLLGIQPRRRRHLNRRQ